MLLEYTLASPLNSKEIKPVNLKENQPWIFTGRTDAEAPILWPPDAKSWLIGKDPDAGKDWGQEENRATENEMVGWHCWLSGHEFEETLGNGKPGMLQSMRSQRDGHKWAANNILQFKTKLKNQSLAFICKSQISCTMSYLRVLYTLLYLKWITKKNPLYRELCSMLCGSLDGRGV